MPNKAKIRAQFRLFKGIESGAISAKPGLSKKKAAAMTGDQSPKGLPERLGPTGKPKKLSGQARRAR